MKSAPMGTGQGGGTGGSAYAVPTVGFHLPSSVPAWMMKRPLPPSVSPIKSRAGQAMKRSQVCLLYHASASPSQCLLQSGLQFLAGIGIAPRPPPPSEKKKKEGDDEWIKQKVKEVHTRIFS